MQLADVSREDLQLDDTGGPLFDQQFVCHCFCF